MSRTVKNHAKVGRVLTLHDQLSIVRASVTLQIDTFLLDVFRAESTVVGAELTGIVVSRERSLRKIFDTVK